MQNFQISSGIVSNYGSNYGSGDYGTQTKLKSYFVMLVLKSDIYHLLCKY